MTPSFCGMTEYLQVLCREVQASSVLKLLVVADRHDATELKATCVKVKCRL